MPLAKTKILSSFNDSGVDRLLVRGMALDILALDSSHRYLGRLVSMSEDRCSIEVSNRIRAAWAKYAQHRRWLTNRCVPLHLRLKLFDSVISPSALFASGSLPLTATHMRRFGCR